ncbi:MAG TPA: response regulator [Vicinamibacterales bacterium]|nr:response regulator [Vicinamibacterales bacterium]
MPWYTPFTQLADRMADEEYLTTEEVLEYLHLTRRTVYRLVKAGKIPANRIGHQYRYRRRDIQTWLTANRRILRHAGLEGSDRPRVLVVDDEESVRNLVARTLEKECEVETVADGPAAVDRLQAAEYDLLITDLRMPGMDGLSVIRQIRQIRQGFGLPVIVLTGFSTEANAIEALNLGVTGYLTKPFRLERMIEMAHKAVGLPIEPEAESPPTS